MGLSNILLKCEQFSGRRCCCWQVRYLEVYTAIDQKHTSALT